MSSSEKFPALVSTEWLADALQKRTTPSGRPLRILDATWLGMGTEGRDAHSKQHIPSSLHVDLNTCRDTSSQYLFTVPPPDVFAEFVGKTLGVGNNAHVVVYENDPFYKLMSTARIWWMFRLYGHDAVSILDGGLQQWIAEGRPVTDQATSDWEPQTFTTTTRRDHLYARYEDVLLNQTEPKFQLMDSRPVEWYDGTMPSAWPGLTLGIIKTAINIPFPQVLRDNSSKFKSPDELRAIFGSNDIDLSRPVTSTCFVGITACILALSAFVAGKEDVAVFDGSWDEYSRRGPKETMQIFPGKAGSSAPDLPYETGEKQKL